MPWFINCAKELTIKLASPFRSVLILKYYLKVSTSHVFLAFNQGDKLNPINPIIRTRGNPITKIIINFIIIDESHWTSNHHQGCDCD